MCVCVSVCMVCFAVCFCVFEIVMQWREGSKYRQSQHLGGGDSWASNFKRTRK